MIGLILVVLIGVVVLGVAVEVGERRADREAIADAERRAHQRLMRELGRLP